MSATYSQNMRYTKKSLKAFAEKISQEMNVELDPNASKEELANWLSIMEGPYQEEIRRQRFGRWDPMSRKWIF